ncbi:MAG: PilZ domain-containing protein [Sphingobium sp.]
MNKNDQAVGVPDERTGSRDSMLLLAILHDGEGNGIGQARVRNISAAGMLADCAALVEPGTRVRFDLRGVGEITGEVVRYERGQIGVQFDRKIDPKLARRPVGKPATSKG